MASCRRMPSAPGPTVTVYDFPAGTDSSGATLHVCRAFYNGGLFPGKTQSTWKTCNFGLAGAEVAATYYEILSH